MKKQKYKSLSFELWGPWATMLTWVNSYKSLIQHFRLSVDMATNPNEEFEQLLYAWWRITHQTFIKTLCDIKSEMRSFKSNQNIHKKEGGSYYVVSANKASSVTL